MDWAHPRPYNGRSMSLKSLWEALTGRRADEDKPADDRPPEIWLPTYGPLSVRRDVEGAQSEEVTLLATSENVVSFRSPSLLLADQRIVIETIARQFEAVVRQVEPDGFSYLVNAEILPRDTEAANSVGLGIGTADG